MNILKHIKRPAERCLAKRAGIPYSTTRGILIADKSSNGALVLIALLSFMTKCERQRVVESLIKTLRGEEKAP